jgi:hypothetical protein
LSADVGHITAVVYWDSAWFLPLGWSLCGVDLFFGTMDGNDNEITFVKSVDRGELETIFWNTFWDKVPLEMKLKRESLERAFKISKGIGILWRYVGFGDNCGVSQFLERSLNLVPFIKATI